MPSRPLPCCATAKADHLADLPHVYQFDFDLYRCDACARFWIYAWRENQGGWEPVLEADAQTMQSLRDQELRTFMKTWAEPFH